MQDCNPYYHVFTPYLPLHSEVKVQFINPPGTNLNFHFLYKKECIQKIQLLNQKCEALERQNQSLRVKFKEENIKQNQQVESTEHMQGKIKKSKINQQGIFKIKRITQQRKRIGYGLVRNFKCPYSYCLKEYASQVSLNFHVQSKHDGGTKRHRTRLLKQIIKAELNGTQIPNINVKFPPNYLQETKELLLKGGVMEDIDIKMMQK